MLSEGIGGKCPCCSYNRMLQRSGSQGYYLLDGCPNCGFGYGSNLFDTPSFGFDAWSSYGTYLLSLSIQNRRDGEYFFYETVDEVFENFKYNLPNNNLVGSNNITIRKMIFNYVESFKNDQISNAFCGDTVFQYNENDIKKWMNTNPVIFKKVV